MSKEITIAGLFVSVETPYAAGHVLTEAEAAQLNQVRAENIRNNTATAVAKLGTEAKTEAGKKTYTYSEEATAKAKEIVAAYDKDYVFTMATVGARKSTDPFEKLCESIARDHLTSLIRGKGGKVKDYPKEEIEAKIAEFAAHPEVQKEAKKRMQSRERLADALSLSPKTEDASTPA